ncbi:hypothetical protein NUW58_g7042 [Xylaria curta]|uniref:Uncharacterized protein n=1 Tax=Xylaria curta TaxID=42375 RepID=A0ACC1NNB4_9PEZI|nr:hypothetical protein NUW58_g7042 [Xylaria curta]
MYRLCQVETDTTSRKHESVSEAAKQLLDGGPESQHTAAIPKEHETTASAQASQVDCIEAETITHLSNERQNPLADESNNERDITAPVSPTHLVEEDNRIQVKQENAQDESHILSQDSTMGQQDSNLSDSSSGTGVETPKSEDFIEYEKQEDRHASPEVEVPDHEAQATSIPASSSTTTTSRLKPTNARRFPVGKFFQEHESVPSKSAFPFIAPIDYIPTDPLPIAIFEEQQVPGPRKGGIRGLFAFKGWFKISWINIVAPHSAELVIMLQQKWERKDRFGHAIPSKSRDVSAWNASLAVEWAVIRFQLWEEKSTPPPPRIEKLPEPERPAAKSVNEILRDMRLNDGNGDEQRCENHATLEPGRDKAASEFCSGEDKCSVVT